MPEKRLDYADRARRDLEAIEKYHLEVTEDVIADRIIDAILFQAEKIAALGLMFRPGIRRGTRECVMTRYLLLNYGRIAYHGASEVLLDYPARLTGLIVAQ